MPWFVLYGLGAVIPSAAGLYLSYRDGGTTRFRNLLKGTIDVRYPPVWYAVLVVLIPGINICALLIEHWISGAELDFTTVVHYWNQPLSLLLLIFTTLLIGPFNEEYGWTGYALTLFEERWGKAAGNLALGAIRVVWHLPMFLMVGTDQGSRPLLPFGLAILGLSILCGWVYEGTGRRISSAILVHFIFNISIGSLLPLGNQAYWYRGWLYLILTLVLSIVWEKRVMRNPQEKRSLGKIEEKL